MEDLLQERKTALLNKINQSMDQYVFERALNQSEDDEFLGFTSYQEFSAPASSNRWVAPGTITSFFTA